ncbi:hypothetical protein [Chenggangzhangella methanolivorans]|uniref:Uncharacterized protein n=1 Tax=Chenggangzhangella methanolivorans TaxID=1437009 RepID=A0A9E6R8B3_9HYPH|nr:hypothetical protein [Chenggangzhangella methanolivorans]QZN99679.1 hypothetical protein K6K41_23855 [Chenggangzhangella methanolivorans]
MPGTAGAAAAERSDVCFDEGILKKGSRMDYDMKVSGDGATPPRRISIEVGGVKTFNGNEAVETRAKFFDDAGKPAGVNRTYAAKAKNYLVTYGLESEGVTQFVEPAQRLPINLKKGKSFKQTFQNRNVYGDGREEVTKTNEKYTFNGFEEKKFAVGRYKACVMSIRATAKNAVGTYLTNRTDWIAAEGPYRGLTLRSKISATYSAGFSINQALEVTKVWTFKLK